MACLQEAQHQISVQKVIIEQHVRRLHYRLLWSASQESIGQLRHWLKERFFFQELSYAILHSISNRSLLKRRYNQYLDGIRLAIDE